MDVKTEAKRLSDQIVRWRRELHRIPESGLNCTETAEYICAELDRMEIPWKRYTGHSGITALIGKNQGTVIGLRADMDGLDIQEENRLEYASQNGRMHACGHDAHVAILLGTAKMLKEQENLLNGQVKLIFQPDEEGLSGAKAMLADGVLENPKIDYMAALHVGSIIGHGIKAGQLFWKTGAVFASSDCFRILVKGRGGHASTPFKAVNPVYAASKIIETLQGLVSREVNYTVPSVLTITGIKAGNGAFNIIPDTAEVIGGVRTQDVKTREYLLKRMREIIPLCAKEFGAEAEFEQLSGCPPVVNDPVVTEMLVASARKVLPEEDILELPAASMGGEDAAYYFTSVPGCYVLLYNSCASDDGKEYPHHNSRFCIDDSVLYRGSAVFTQMVLDQLTA